jgi:hypothetical protein
VSSSLRPVSGAPSLSLTVLLAITPPVPLHPIVLRRSHALVALPAAPSAPDARAYWLRLWGNSFRKQPRQVRARPRHRRSGRVPTSLRPDPSAPTRPAKHSRPMAPPKKAADRSESSSRSTSTRASFLRVALRPHAQEGAALEVDSPHSRWHTSSFEPIFARPYPGRELTLGSVSSAQLGAARHGPRPAVRRRRRPSTPSSRRRTRAFRSPTHGPARPPARPPSSARPPTRTRPRAATGRWTASMRSKTRTTRTRCFRRLSGCVLLASSAERRP